MGATPDAAGAALRQMGASLDEMGAPPNAEGSSLRQMGAAPGRNGIAPERRGGGVPPNGGTAGPSGGGVPPSMEHPAPTGVSAPASGRNPGRNGGPLIRAASRLSGTGFAKPREPLLPSPPTTLARRATLHSPMQHSVFAERMKSWPLLMAGATLWSEVSPSTRLRATSSNLGLSLRTRTSLRDPIQTTGDVGRFWREGCPAVKAQLRGRHRKHEWR